MSTDNNAPDEAEGLLNALDQLDAEENKYAIDGTIADVLAVGLARKMVRDNIIPLIRSGLALQRLESAYLDVELWRIDGWGCNVFDADRDGPHSWSGKSDTMANAINAALDAAGVEK